MTIWQAGCGLVYIFLLTGCYSNTPINFTRSLVAGAAKDTFVANSFIEIRPLLSKRERIFLS